MKIEWKNLLKFYATLFVVIALTFLFLLCVIKLLSSEILLIAVATLSVNILFLTIVCVSLSNSPVLIQWIRSCYDYKIKKEELDKPKAENNPLSIQTSEHNVHAIVEIQNKN